MFHAFIHSTDVLLYGVHFLVTPWWMEIFIILEISLCGSCASVNLLTYLFHVIIFCKQTFLVYIEDVTKFSFFHTWNGTYLFFSPNWIGPYKNIKKNKQTFLRISPSEIASRTLRTHKSREMNVHNKIDLNVIAKLLKHLKGGDIVMKTYWRDVWVFL